MSRLRTTNAIVESTFRWTITQFSDEHRKFSPEFLLQDFPFQLEMRKVRTAEESTLKIYLNRTNQLKNVEMVCLVTVKFKLLSFDETVEPHRKALVAAEYGPKGVGNSSVSLISLADLSDPDKKFIQNDSIVIEVRVKADPPLNDTALLPRLQICWNVFSEAKLQLTVKDIGKRIGINSPIFFLRDIPWQVSVDSNTFSVFVLNTILRIFIQSFPCKICVYRNDDMMDIRLRPIHKDLIKNTYYVTSTIKLLPFSPVHNAYEQKYHRQIDENNIVVWPFIQWHELVNPLNRFIRDDDCIKLDFVIEVNDSNRQSLPSSQRLNESGIGCPICFER